MDNSTPEQSSYYCVLCGHFNTQLDHDCSRAAETDEVYNHLIIDAQQPRAGATQTVRGTYVFCMMCGSMSADDYLHHIVALANDTK